MYRQLSQAARYLQHTRACSALQASTSPTEAYGRLVPWSKCLESDSLTTILIRDHEHKPFKVQHSLLAHVCNASRADHLDLTAFDPAAGLTFLFWLYNRRLPQLKQDTYLKPTPPTQPPTDKQRAVAQRELRETFNLGLIESWRLGACISAPRFQNDVLKSAAFLLDEEEVAAGRSADPNYSSAVAWARRAFDSAVDLREERGRMMREFAVDVAAKRVYDVGMSGLTLMPAERLDLSTCEMFAGEVFGSLGAQIGTKGVGIQDFVKAYLVEERGM